MPQKNNTLNNTPKHNLLYGAIVQWITIISTIIAMIAPIFILSKPENNILNPNHIFSAIWQGKTIEEVWNHAGSGFPGAHFYLNNLSAGDGLAQFGIVLGCSVALWALLPIIVSYFKNKIYLYSLICLFICLLIVFSMIGF